MWSSIPASGPPFRYTFKNWTTSHRNPGPDSTGIADQFPPETLDQLHRNPQIVHDEVDGCGRRVCQSQSDRYLGEFESRTIRRGEREMTTRFRLYGAEDVGCAAAFVFVIPSGFPPRLGWRRGPNI